MSNIIVPSLYNPNQKPMLGTPLVHNDGIIGSWPFNEGGGTIVHDNSGFGRDGELLGDTTWHTTASRYKVLTINFKGDGGDYINLGQTGMLDGLDTFTISGWIKHDTWATDQALFWRAGADFAVTGSLGFFHDRDEGSSGGEHVFTFITTEGASNFVRGVTTDGTVVRNVWYHIAAVYEKGKAHKVYVDGVDKTVFTTNTALGNFPALAVNEVFGNDSSGTGRDLNGKISSVQISNKALAAVEISKLYVDSFWRYRPLPIIVNVPTIEVDSPRYIQKPMIGTPIKSEPTGLIGAWAINERGGTTIHDTSGNGNHATAVAGNSWSRDNLVLEDQELVVSDGKAGALDLSGDISIIWQCRPTDLATDLSCIASQWGNVGDHKQWELYYNQIGALKWRIHDGANRTGTSPIEAVDNIVDNRAVVWHAGVGVDFYKDGILDDSDILAFTQTLVDPKRAFIGGAGDDDAGENDAIWEFRGELHYLFILDRALTSNEVMQFFIDPYWMWKSDQIQLWVATQAAAYLRTINDPLGLVDTRTQSYVGVRTVSESLGLTDTDTKNEGKTLAESLGLTDDQVRLYEATRTLAESLGLTDDDTKNEDKTLAESLGLTDTATNVSVILRTIAESIGLTDALVAGAIYLETVNDGVGISDVPSSLSTMSRVIAESLGITDTQARAYVGIRIIAETLGLTDAASAGSIYLETVNDDVGILDAYSSLSTIVRVVAESLGITDAQAQVYVGIRTIAEAMGLTDTDSKNEGKTVAESLGIADDDVKDEGKNLTEAMGLADDVSRLCVVLRTLAESVGLTDAISVISPGGIDYIEIISEALGITDSMFKLQPVVISAAWAWIAELIAEEGRLVTLTKAQGRRLDATQPWRGNTSFTTPEPGLDVTAVMVRYKSSEVDGSLVLKTDQKALIAVPTTGQNVLEYDILTDTTGDAKAYKIVRPVKIHPGTEILLYILQVRR